MTRQRSILVLLLGSLATSQTFGEGLSWLNKASEAGVEQATALLEKIKAVTEKRN